MIKITKDEAMYLRENSPESKIAVTGGKKRSRHKKWYTDEMPITLSKLKEFNKNRATEVYS